MPGWREGQTTVLLLSSWDVIGLLLSLIILRRQSILCGCLSVLGWHYISKYITERLYIGWSLRTLGWLPRWGHWDLVYSGLLALIDWFVELPLLVSSLLVYKLLLKIPITVERSTVRDSTCRSTIAGPVRRSCCEQSLHGSPDWSIGMISRYLLLPWMRLNKSVFEGWLRNLFNSLIVIWLKVLVNWILIDAVLGSRIVMHMIVQLLILVSSRDQSLTGVQRALILWGDLGSWLIHILGLVELRVIYPVLILFLTPSDWAVALVLIWAAALNLQRVISSCAYMLLSWEDWLQKIIGQKFVNMPSILLLSHFRTSWSVVAIHIQELSIISSSTLLPFSFRRYCQNSCAQHLQEWYHNSLNSPSDSLG